MSHWLTKQICQVSSQYFVCVCVPCSKLVAWSKSGHSRINSDIFMLPYRKLISFFDAWDKILQNRKKTSRTVPLALYPTAGPLSFLNHGRTVSSLLTRLPEMLQLPNKSLGRILSLKVELQWPPDTFIFLFTVEMQTVHTSKYLKTTLLRLRNTNYFLLGHAIKEKHTRNHIGGNSGKLY